MQLARRIIIQALLHKGFEMFEKNNHIYFKYRYLNGEMSNRATFMSRGSKYKSIGDALIADMSKQLGLTRKQFIDLVNCPLSREEYEAIISA